MRSDHQESPLDVLVTAPMPLEATGSSHSRLKLHRLWEMSEADISAVGDSVRGVATIAHYGRLDAGFMNRFPKLEIISSFGVRYDNAVDVAEARRRGLVVTNTPDLMNDEVADFIVGLLIATVRRFGDAERFVRRGDWASGAYPLTSSLRGRKIGIAGLGKIGARVARRLSGFDLDISYFARRERNDVPYRFFDDLAEMARHTDVLILCLPGNADTKHIVTREVLASLGKEGVVINAARGSLVSDELLAAVLRDGTISAAGLDVFENEPCIPAALLESERALLLPHIASASEFTRKAMGQLVLDNLGSYLAGHGALTPVPN